MQSTPAGLLALFVVEKQKERPAMRNDIVPNPAVEDALILGPGRVKRGLLWLESEEAEKFGLSLDRLIERAVLNPQTSKDFNLSYSPTCAIGYASEGRPYYYDVHSDKGAEWMEDNGFYVQDCDPLPYEILTREWRTQLRALAEERALQEAGQ